MYRGGGWYNGRLSALLVNHQAGEPTIRDPLIGVRVCTSLPTEPGQVAIAQSAAVMP
jgi:hypothetical protein